MSVSAETATAALPRRRVGRPVSAIVLSGIVSVIEGALTVVSGLAVFYVYLGAFADDLVASYGLVIIVAAQIQMAAFSGAHLYDIPCLRRPFRNAGRLFAVWACVFAALAVLAFLTKTGATAANAAVFRSGGISCMTRKLVATS